MGRFASILFEVKFTERQAGCCSQTQRLGRVGQAQCNGNFELQVNPANQISNRCALTGKGIRYEERTPADFPPEPRGRLSPLPVSRTGISVDAESSASAVPSRKPLTSIQRSRLRIWDQTYRLAIISRANGGLRSSVYCGKRHRHQDRSKFGSSCAALQLLNQV